MDHTQFIIPQYSYIITGFLFIIDEITGATFVSDTPTPQRDNVIFVKGSSLVNG